MSHLTTLIFDVDPTGYAPSELRAIVADAVKRATGQDVSIHSRDAYAHGTRSKYGHDSCRCTSCTHANTSYAEVYRTG